MQYHSPKLTHTQTQTRIHVEAGKKYDGKCY